MRPRHARLCLALSMMLPLTGCVRVVSFTSANAVKGSGVELKETREAGPVTSVDAGSVFRVTVSPDAMEGIRVIGDDNIVPLVRTELMEGKLTVGLRENTNVQPRLPLVIGVRSNDLRSVHASGVTQIEVESTEAETLEVSADGASSVTVKKAGPKSATVDVNGTSQVKVQGKTGTLRVEVSGASSADLGGFAAETVEVEVSGTGTAEVAATRSVRGEASGVGSVRVRGNPAAVEVKTSGTASVSKVN